jgi:hypothetical protein
MSPEAALWSRRYICEHCGHRGRTSGARRGPTARCVICKETTRCRLLADTLADNVARHGVPLAEQPPSHSQPRTGASFAPANNPATVAQIAFVNPSRENLAAALGVDRMSPAIDAARLVIAQYRPDGDRWCGQGWYPATETEVAAVIAPALEGVRDHVLELRRQRDAALTQLRAAWEMGFALCRQYGDNHAHFDGEQKERQWKKALAALNQTTT